MTTVQRFNLFDVWQQRPLQGLMLVEKSTVQFPRLSCSVADRKQTVDPLVL